MRIDPDNKHAQNAGFVLTWIPAAIGNCWSCKRDGKARTARLYAALENETDPPICGECVVAVENIIQEQRRIDGVQCYRCNRTVNLTPHGVELGGIYEIKFACPVCKAADLAERANRPADTFARPCACRGACVLTGGAVFGPTKLPPGMFCRQKDLQG